MKYEKGRLNTQADALSRLPTTGGTTLPIDEEIPCYIMDNLQYEDKLASQDDEEEDPFLYAPDAIDHAEGDALLAMKAYVPDEELLNPVTRDELRRQQLADPFCASMRRALNGRTGFPLR